MHVGIIGHEAAKFTPETEAAAKQVIAELLRGDTLVSGHCHLGGIDIWAEEYAEQHQMPMKIYPPTTRSWAGGYKARNILIAENSDIVHCILVAKLPDSYAGMKFKSCYHCGTDKHVKSGACWTAKYAQKLGKKAVWHVIG